MQQALNSALKDLSDFKFALDAHAIMAVTDHQGRITYVNEKFCAISKYSKEELLGQDHRIINSGFHSKEFFRDLWSTIGRGAVWKGDIRNRAKDGSIYWVGTTIVPFLNEEGKPFQFVSLRTDITAHKLAEEEVIKLNQMLDARVKERTWQLEQANKELEAFSYSVSHDLRAPLRHIDGFIALLKRSCATGLPETTVRYIEMVAQSSQQMGKLIDNLLKFSRIGRAAIRLESVDTNLLVKEAIEATSEQAQGRKVIWRVSPLPRVVADYAMLRQVILNLLSNAVKYTGQRESALIEIGCDSSNPGETVFFVRDNGAGFDMDYADKLFGVFQRLHRDDEFEGTGIGLAIVHQIIKRHGGRVWAEGKINSGATFYFSLKNEAANNAYE